MVDELIDSITRGWDELLIRQTFWLQDVDIILSIPIHVEMEDVIAWHYDTRGMLSIRSAYKVQRAHEKRSSEWLPHLVEGMEWIPIFGKKKLWNLNCPGKIKHHLWSMADNSLQAVIGMQMVHG